ncbi:MAG: hypothetical protein ACYDH6_08665 [Acidimicrobiales bacterium]
MSGRARKRAELTARRDALRADAATLKGAMDTGGELALYRLREKLSAEGWELIRDSTDPDLRALYEGRRAPEGLSAADQVVLYEYHRLLADKQILDAVKADPEANSFGFLGRLSAQCRDEFIDEFGLADQPTKLAYAMGDPDWEQR